MTKIIQILAPDPQHMVALCSDGTLWRLGRSVAWTPLPLPPPIAAGRKGRFVAPTQPPRRRRPAS